MDHFARFKQDLDDSGFQPKTPHRVDRLVPDGTYTVVGSDGFNTTLSIEDAKWATIPKEGSKWPPKPVGTKTAGLLIGPNNTRDFQNFCWILPDGSLIPWRNAADKPMRALKALLSSSDPQKYGYDYALASGRCFRCGRVLTVEASINRGLGPDCAAIVGEWFEERRRGGHDLPSVPPIESAPIEQIPVAPVTQSYAPVADDTITYEGGVIRVSMRWGSPGFDEKKAAVKGAGFRWNPDVKVWEKRVTPATAQEDIAVLRRFKSFAAVESKFDEHRAIAEQNLAASVAAAGTFVPKGINKGLALRPYQAAAVDYIVRSENGGVIEADEMGLGKTITFLATIAHLGCKKTLIIPPASLRLNWKKEADKWVTGARVLVVKINKPPTREMLNWANIVLLNYESCDTEKYPWLLTQPWDAIGCDEAHYCKNPKAQRTQRVKEIISRARSRGTLRVCMMMTGTPILNRPLELYPLIELIGREDAVGGFWNFTKRYCDAHKTVQPRKVNGRVVMKEAWDFTGASNLVELNRTIRQNGIFVRRLKKDVLLELPEKSYEPVAMELTPEQEALYVSAEQDVIDWMYKQDDNLRRLVEAATQEADKRAVPDDERMQFIAEYIGERRDKAEAARQLVQFEGLFQVVWKAKRDSVLGWIDHFLSGSDKKIVLFCNHTAVLEELADRYNAPVIAGGMKGEEIEAGKERFQTDPECRVIVCNHKAGGMGHTLTAASDVGIIELPWTPGLLDQSTDRVHRDGQRNAVISWMLLASRTDGEPTIDEMVAELLTGKRAVVDALIDGKAEGGDDDEQSVKNAVAGRLLAKRGKVV